MKGEKKKVDIIEHYIVSPKDIEDSRTPINMKQLIGHILSYIQNNEIYFKYNPSMYIREFFYLV